MINISLNTSTPVIDQNAMNRAAKGAADDIAASVVNYVKLAIVGHGAIATGKTLRSIKAEMILDSGTRGLFIRHVTGNRAWQNIQGGRKAGKKMPVQVVSGASKRGGLVFQPVPEMLEWFTALNIPRAAWFPIMRKIAKRGIKPRDIRDTAVINARGRIAAICNIYARQLANDLLRANGVTP